MAKIRIDAALYERVKKIVEIAGYGSVEEFVIHVIEKELSNLETTEDEAEITERLRGLGYLE